MTSLPRVPVISGGIKVLGVKFQAFVDPSTSQPVFSQRGAARALKMPGTSLRRILMSEDFKALRGGYYCCTELNTTVSSTPISVITQADLVLLVQIAAEKGYFVARSMQEASFAVLLQQSVDEALGVERTRKEYLDAGASLRQKLEYRYSYHSMKESTFEKGHGVRGLCKVNRQVSSLAVHDADSRRALDKGWRRDCSGLEMVKITIGNTVHQKAVDASSPSYLDTNLGIALQRTSDIYHLLDAPF